MLLVATTVFAASDRQAVDYVNPLIGSARAGFDKGLEGGGTMPWVGRPFAMTHFVAQAHENKISIMPYTYEDTRLFGFLATHQPTVWMGDYGYVSVMPQTGPIKVLPEERALKFCHTNEISRPYYYSVQLDGADSGPIKAEIAAASRCGLLRFTFSKSDQARVIIQGINLNPKLGDWVNDYASRLKTIKGYVHVEPKLGEITGYNPDRQSAQYGPKLPNFKGYFLIQCDKEINDWGTWNEKEIHANSLEQFGTRMGAYVGFKTKPGEVVHIRIGTSFISIDQARKNLEHEIPDWNFDALVQRTRQAWQKNLSRLEISGATEDQKAIFYTALFHCMLFPREFSEYGKYYSAFDDKVHDGVSYNDFSLWDTFRAEHPLLQLVQPERVNDMIKSLLQMYREGGWLPKWPNPTYTGIMIGSHADSVIADAFVKGFRGYDTNLAYEAIRKDAFVPPDGDSQKRWADRDRWTSCESRGGLSYYQKRGYIPCDKTAESVSRTIEFSYDDFCVAQVAKALGKTADYESLIASSHNYRHVFNPATAFMAPRTYNGDWSKKPDDGFTEGSNWTYTFGALHDPEGMVEIMGGKEKFAARLDENFSGAHYRHDNEPGHHYIYLYDYCGQPWKTQELARKHASFNYRNAPIGINGNDDCGQMSAWYLFTVMGFYPVRPGTEEYALGAPQFPRCTIQLLKNGRLHPFEILAKNLSEKNLYVQSVTLDGVQINQPFITFTQIMNGRQLVFEMGPTPVKPKS